MKLRTVLIALAVLASSHNANAELCTLEWRATVDGAPSLEPVSLQITTPSDGGLVYSTLAWQEKIHLRCGANYAVEATLLRTGETHTRELNLVTSSFKLWTDFN